MHHHEGWFHFAAPWAVLDLSNRETKAPQSKLERAIAALIRSQEETGGSRTLEGHNFFTMANRDARMAPGPRFKP